MKSALTLLAFIFIAFCARADYDSDADERKADWLFLQALEQKMAGNTDAHYALMNRALELTPDKSGREAYEVGALNAILAGYLGDSITYNKAVGLLRNYFHAHPADMYGGAFLADLYANSNRSDLAIEIYETLENHHPDKPALLSNHAEMLLNLKRYDEAIDLYRHIEKTLGSSPTLTQRISNIYLWKGDTAQALDVVEQYIAENPRSVDAMQLGTAASSKFGDKNKALEYLNRAIEIDPTNGNTYFYAASVYRGLGLTDKYDEAIRGAVGGDDLEPAKKVEVLRYYFSEQDSITDSIYVCDVELLDLLTRLHPTNRDALTLAGSFYAGNQRWNEAARQWRQIIDNNEPIPADYNVLARLYFSGDNKPRAVATLKEALEEFPREVDLYTLLSGIYSGMELPDSALSTLKLALDIDSLSTMERSDLLRDYADMLQNHPSPSELPDEYYEQSIAENPDNDLAMNNYAYYLVDKKKGGDLLKAKELIAKAVLYNPGSSTYYDTYAWVLFRLGDLQGAKRYIDLAITSNRSLEEGDDADLAEVLLHAGYIYEALGQHKEAKEYWQRAADLDDDEISAEATKQLNKK